MKTYYYLAKDRGLTSASWLKSYYSFNFETMDEFEKIRFGQLRILNNDTITGGTGFSTHSHRDMEIITIPLSGGLKHTDSLGNSHEILPGDVQVMTAGTGIRHSEYNNFEDKDTNFLQIWVFPDQNGLLPRYDQHFFPLEKRHNEWALLIAPNQLAPLYINQSAYFSRAQLDSGKVLTYSIHGQDQGVLFYVVSGDLKIGEEIFTTGDAVGFKDVSQISIYAIKNADILAIEVPFLKKHN
jgi:redox-sensitive bicupin YhaK (pirin superfamily)